MAAEPSFEWDEDKSRVNQEKHGVAFETAQLAFLDERRVIAEDLSPQRGRAALLLLRHSAVRFPWREGRIRIFGAGYWRKGKRLCDTENKKVHRGRDRRSQGR
jgi:uncharacterized protein